MVDLCHSNHYSFALSWRSKGLQLPQEWRGVCHKAINISAAAVVTAMPLTDIKVDLPLQMKDILIDSLLTLLYHVFIYPSFR